MRLPLLEAFVHVLVLFTAEAIAAANSFMHRIDPETGRRWRITDDHRADYYGEALVGFR